jgi:hypothetical protein
MLPPLLEVDEIRTRLQAIFPEGIPERSKCTGLAAARTVYVMLYVGAIENGEWLAPKYVYRMGNSQAAKTSDADRTAYLAAVRKPGTPEPSDRWYKENTRESIRDEALKQGLVPIGAVLMNPQVPTTSGKGRYILRADFAALFDPRLIGDAFEQAVGAWRDKHLSPAALATVKVLQIAASGAKTKVSVMLPNGEGRTMAPGLSSVITKAVIEIFAPRFLTNPAVPWVSESGKKVVEKDDSLLKALGISISPEKLLPDVILADTGGGALVWTFVEIVATDGPIHATRRAQLLKLITDAGFKKEHAAFVTAFQSREHQAFKKTVASLAWGSFAWCLSEPEHLIAFDGMQAGTVKSLGDFMPST